MTNVAQLKQRWKAAAGMGAGLGIRSPVVANGVVHLGSDYGRLMVYSAKAPDPYCWASPRQCQPFWYGLAGSTILGTPVVTGGKVYVKSHGSGGRAPTVTAFDAAGKVGCKSASAPQPRVCNPVWRATTGDNDYGSPAVANGVVYVGSADHKLSAFSRVANGLLFIGSDDHRLYAYSAAGTKKCAGTPKVCQPLWKGQTGGFVESTPAVAGASVYVAADDGWLYAYTIP